jgi:hypothetical protein
MKPEEKAVKAIESDPPRLRGFDYFAAYLANEIGKDLF